MHKPYPTVGRIQYAEYNVLFNDDKYWIIYKVKTKDYGVASKTRNEDVSDDLFVEKTFKDGLEWRFDDVKAKFTVTGSFISFSFLIRLIV